MSSRSRRPALAAVLVLPALLVTGCSSASEKISEKAAEKMIEKQSGGSADVDLDGDKVKIQTEDGSFTAGGTEVPASWPADVPLPDDLEVTYVAELGAGAEAQITMTGQSGMGAEEFVAFYESAMTGWEVLNKTNMASDGSVITGAMFELDGRQVAVGATGGDGPTQVTFTYIQGAPE